MAPKRKNFFTGPNAIFEIGLNPYQIAVYLYISRCGNNASAFPSFPTIAEKTGMGVRKAKDVVSELVEMGLLERQHRYGEKGRESNLYKVIEPELRGAQSAPSNEEVSASHAPTLVHDMHGGSAPHALYKELSINNIRDKDKRYIALTSDGHPFLHIYDLHYKNKFGKSHPDVSEEQLHDIISRLEHLQDYGVDEDQLHDAVYEHFNTLPESNDGKIFAFLHASFRYFEVRNE
ncbi:helix-turn-helix domain-containing protein [Paenibacillus sp. 598K]|uniref:helix-turn-helix domain-containing protein n=1 Tax=Paenibacillus sp. 598K TaxID=1117987 RepID=UPI000FF92BDA|nr:helix-turn-helix domain-containing protein [Paenibacillus sp. 598K]GBF78268.1 helix-turn-helix domain-containing protein [Paenibacillus sp. 598K]